MFYLGWEEKYLKRKQLEPDLKSLVIVFLLHACFLLSKGGVENYLEMY